MKEGVGGVGAALPGATVGGADTRRVTLRNGMRDDGVLLPALLGPTLQQLELVLMHSIHADAGGLHETPGGNDT